jgi:hypothetical protein
LPAVILVILTTHAGRGLPVEAKVYVVKAVLENLRYTVNFVLLAIPVVRNF